MRLDKIKLAGFKSFVDPTSLRLTSNRAAIVGPNGCGKSNVIDAVRWVVGESSAKQLRGNSLDDVIFNGSRSRAPVGLASVELVFDNSAGRLGGSYGQYSEIAIKRVLARDGESHYYFNGTRCRRRDIADVFLGTGFGPRGYAIIEQGTISRIVEADPQELRQFLEEVSGLSKYKERRKETAARIESARDNLNRLNDIKNELQSQLDALARQAASAEKYHAIKIEERQLKADLLALRWRAIGAARHAAQHAIAECELRYEATRSELRHVERLITVAREQATSIGTRLDEKQADFYRASNELQQAEQAIVHSDDTRAHLASERANLQRDVARLAEHRRADQSEIERREGEYTALETAQRALTQAEGEAAARMAEDETAYEGWRLRWEALRRQAAASTTPVEQARIRELQRHLDTMTARRAGLSQEIARLEQEYAGEQAHVQIEKERQAHLELEKINNEIKLLKDKHEKEMESCAGLRRRLHETEDALRECRATVTSLKVLQHAALGQSNHALEAWLDDLGLGGAARLAQRIEVDGRWEQAVEVVLGARLGAVCGSDVPRAAAAAERFTRGEVLLLEDTVPQAAVSGDRFMPLEQHIRGAAVQSLVAGVYCADDTAAALALRAQLQAYESVVTPDGLWFGRDWMCVARRDAEQTGVLGREQELRRLERLHRQAVATQADLQQELARHEAVLRATTETQLGLDQRARTLERTLATLTAERAALDARGVQRDARKAQMMREHEQLMTQIQAEQGALAAAGARLEQARRAELILDAEHEHLKAEGDALESARLTARTRLETQRGELQQAALKLEANRAARATLEQTIPRQARQAELLTARVSEIDADLAASDQRRAIEVAQRERNLDARTASEAMLAAARRDKQAIDEELRQHETTRQHCEQRLDEERAILERERLVHEQQATRATALLEQAAEMDIDLQQIADTLAPEVEESVWQRRLDHLAQRLQRLGPINLAAIEERQRAAERMSYMDAQHGDLSEALDTLEGSMRKIDRETRQRFKETFEQVNAHMGALFPRLFGGGEAHLTLTAEDLLETGVAVMARPPGKRVSTIHLLSGGEKALTAIAFVFALFELNPAPVCLLDEVDAPLDDANVGRFCSLVREMSERVQFIVITHNKTTMELGRELIGVTMQEPGVSRLVAVDIDEAIRMTASAA